MVTSGATGWDPNVAKYTVADHIFGPWAPLKNFAPDSQTTFGSQSTHIIPVEGATGKFIYMGDRWKKDNLKDSRYIWLPIKIADDGAITLSWRDEWTLNDL